MGRIEKELMKDLRHLVEAFYDKKLKSYRFRSEELEEKTWDRIDELVEELQDVAFEKIISIDKELEEAEMYSKDERQDFIDEENFVLKYQL